MEPDVRARLLPPHPVSLQDTLGPLLRGPGSLSSRVERDGSFWRATRNPGGTVTIRYAHDGTHITVEAWGPGAERAVEDAPHVLGFHDSTEDFQPAGRLAELHRLHPGLRIPRTRAVMEALYRSITEQKVSGKEAHHSHEDMVRAWGEPAPGPLRMVVPPAPSVVASMPYHAFHPFNLEMKRANTLRGVAARPDVVERTADMPVLEAWRTLGAFPGVGPWTVGEVALVAWGDADAVQLGDWHMPHTVTFAFTGEPRGSDERMLELLEPYRGHRGRVTRLLMLAGIMAPRFGPRRAMRDIRRH